jgi:hypothetical protein
MRVNGWKGIDNEARETTNEMALIRRQIGVSGEILWHSAPLLANHAGVADALRKGVYGGPALVPACTWLGNALPARPVLTARENGREITLNWKEESGGVWQWVVRKKTGGRWTTEILPGAQTKEVVPDGAGSAPLEIIAVSAVNRCGNMGGAAVFNTGHLEK